MFHLNIGSGNSMARWRPSMDIDMPELHKPTMLDAPRGAINFDLPGHAARLGSRAAMFGMQAFDNRQRLAGRMPDWTLPNMPWQSRRRASWMRTPRMPWTRRATVWQSLRAVPGQHSWELPTRGRQRSSHGAQLWQLVGAALLGALVVYLFDPDRGHQRRTLAIQRTTGMARDMAGGLRRAGRYMAHTAAGKRQMLTRGGRRSHEPLDDVTLAHKVESVLFRDPGVPKGNINVNSEHGIVVIRGEVETTDDIREIEQRVRHIEGVQDVRTLLHLAHTPAPNA